MRTERFLQGNLFGNIICCLIVFHRIKLRFSTDLMDCGIKQIALGRSDFTDCPVIITDIFLCGTDFIFLNRFGQPQHPETLNKAIRRIIRDCNDEQLLKDENAKVLLPHFSCHSLRHTFTTRMCEAGVNVKVIQDTLGHKDISTTLNIYTDVTKGLRRSEFEGLDSYFKNEYNKAN